MKHDVIIGIDGNEANVTQRVGVSVVAYELLKGFAKLQRFDPRVKIIVYLREKPSFDMPAASENWQYQIIWGPKFWLDLFLPLYLITHQKPDVYLAPAHYAPPWPKLRIVTIIHDLAFLYFPSDFLKKDHYKLVNWTKRTVSAATKIIAVSAATKTDLLRTYQIGENKISMIPNGFSPPLIAGEDVREVGGVNRHTQYLLYVGTLQARKNLSVLIKALRLLKKDWPDLKLVIAGRKGWIYDEIFDLVKQSSLEDEVIFTGYVSDAERTFLYQNAKCFVLPSKYEGFGMPVLEAMSLGCPVVAADNSSLPQVGGEAALYADTDSPASFASQINHLLSDEHLRHDMQAKGWQQVKKFSFVTMSERLWRELIAIAGK